MKKLNVVIYVLVIVSMMVTGCAKKGSETEVKKDNIIKEDKVMLTGGKNFFMGYGYHEILECQNF